MADLTKERSSDAAPFTYVGMDMFGPFVTKEGRDLLKRYGAIFTCLAGQAIHLEVVNSMDTDPFIMCLRSFTGSCGNVRMLRSNHGSNFIGAEKDLSKGFLEMDQNKNRQFEQNLGNDWIIWKKNPPARSRFGGIWERQVRSAKEVLRSLLRTNGSSLNDKALNTLMIEVDAIVNSRPLTIEIIADATSEAAISPSNLLTMKSEVVIPPPGSFGTPDLYSKRRWRRIQHFANQFWSRWRKEFLTSLQTRSKWSKSRPNLTIANIVLLKTEVDDRNHWPMAKVISCETDKKCMF